MEAIMQQTNTTPAHSRCFGERHALPSIVNERPFFTAPHNLQTDDLIKERRREPRVRMRVVNRGTMGLMMPGGRCTIDPGENEVTIFRSEVRDLLAMVEPNPAGLAEAEHEYLRGLVAFIIEEASLVNIDEHNLAKLTKMAPDEQEAFVLGCTDPKFNEYLDRAHRLTGKSVEGNFRMKYRRDPRPLVSAVELEELGLPEELPEARQASAAASANAPLVEVLQKQIESQGKLLEALMADRADKKGK